MTFPFILETWLAFALINSNQKGKCRVIDYHYARQITNRLLLTILSVDKAAPTRREKAITNDTSHDLAT
ncbi:hypothetical protein BOO28_13585 [Vibrio navarrensis]|nr:hypothetical protein [Vibrio navarrensis]MBE4608727.1 hypothetical protein [Vibrio navarrensis]MBE4612193.1 hypothetical protein [Vibrio navarrensis]